MRPHALSSPPDDSIVLPILQYVTDPTNPCGPFRNSQLDSKTTNYGAFNPRDLSEFLYIYNLTLAHPNARTGLRIGDAKRFR